MVTDTSVGEEPELPPAPAQIRAGGYPKGLIPSNRYLVQRVDSLMQPVRDESGRELACQTHRAAAAPLSSGLVLKAMAACGAAFLRHVPLNRAATIVGRCGVPCGKRRW